MANVITNENSLAKREVIVKNTHRGLWYEDGVLVRTLDAGRHVIPGRAKLLGRRRRVEVVLVYMRERELTIKGQEILTWDKVATRVSTVVQFRVTDPAAAVEQVAKC
jgi:regulator of protease activity HflC (stomatin/prohibitin superfamily)